MLPEGRAVDDSVWSQTRKDLLAHTQCAGFHLNCIQWMVLGWGGWMYKGEAGKVPKVEPWRNGQVRLEVQG